MNYKLIGLSPDNLKALYTGNSEVDQQITAAGVALRVALEAGEKLEADAATLKANQDLSASGRMKKFREMEAGPRQAALRKLSSAVQQVSARIEALEQQMLVLPTPDDEGARRENNLVNAIRAMDPERRRKLVDQLDDEIAGAVLRNHPLALGMTASEQEMFRAHWQNGKFSAERKSLEREAAILGHLQRAATILDEFSEETLLGLRQTHISRR
jgi:hypothetical protein